MYRRTFEVFAKFIAKQNNVEIVFDTDGGAHANMKTNVLHLPKEIADDNAFGALALTMHEAAHIKHSKVIPAKEVAPMQSDFHILNAIEDIRIDLKNFQVLPNVFSFYEDLVKKHMDLTSVGIQAQLKKNQSYKDIPESAVRLCAGILIAEGFSPKMNKADKEFLTKSKLVNILDEGVYQIEHSEWKKLKKTIQDIKKLLNIDPSKDVPNKAQYVNGDPNGDDEGEGIPVAVEGEDGQGDKPGQGAAKPDPNDLSGTGKLMKPAAIWGKGNKMPGGSMMATNPLAMDEQCAKQFKEILNVKEIKVIEEGSTLDTDSLVSFYTGDIETLFKQEKTVRKKKSKIMFLIDASGSMGTKLLDNKSRAAVVKSCVQKLTEILNEVQHLEGLNVDWCVSQFDDYYKPLTKDGWQSEYRPDGGTNFISGFDGAMNDMVKDYTVEGKRIIVAFSDGDIGGSEIDHVNTLIGRNHSDVRALVIGVGSDMQGKFVKDIVGNNVIIAEDNATEIIMETIKAML